MKNNVNNISILYSCDKNYLIHMAASMASCMNNCKETITFYVFENDIYTDDKEKIRKLCKKNNCNVIFMNVVDKLNKFNLSTTFNLNAFSRLLSSSVIDIDKIIYLDCDTIVIGDISRLWNTDIDGFLIAGVQDTVSWPLRKVVDLEYSDRYLNSGVLLLNLKEWRKNTIENKFLECITKFNGNVPHNDQGILNYVCNNSKKLLDLSYNVYDTVFYYSKSELKKMYDMEVYYSEMEIKRAIDNPIIIHYTEAFYGRPWFVDCNHPRKNEYLIYRKSNSKYWEEKYNKSNFKKIIRRKIKNMCYIFLPFSLYMKLMFIQRSKRG